MSLIHRSTRIFIPLIAVFVWLSSCESRKTDSASLSYDKKISFEKLDSLRIDYLGNPTVHDIDPKSRTVLFMGHKQNTEDMMVANFEGEILESFSKLGDVPDGYGKLMSTLRIYDDITFIAYGYNGFLTYDFTGNLQSKVKFKKFKIPYFSRMTMGYGMEKLDSRYIYTNQEEPVNISHSDRRFYEEVDFDLCEWYLNTLNVFEYK